ncbi:MAG: transcription elongation factor GreB [Betaproteobacteria bacterium]|jgi:transcription elongation factor GreB
MSEKNYITPQGMKRLKEEALNLIDHERPELVKVIQWAASNGDRSENGDYIYGKKRLREIDKRIRFLTKKLDAAVVIDPSTREQTDQIFFGATVTVERESGATQTVSIVGIDEADAKQGLISWVSPLAKSLFKARVGDSVTLRSPKGDEELYVASVDYREINP